MSLRIFVDACDHLRLQLQVSSFLDLNAHPQMPLHSRMKEEFYRSHCVFEPVLVNEPVERLDPGIR